MIMRVFKKIIAVLLCLGFLMGGIAVMRHQAQQADALAFFQNLGAGWNLGNTLDCHRLRYETDNPLDFEVYWGNPVTTKELFAAVRQAGFKTVRIPVTWYPHMDENNVVDGRWMDRVAQVVDDALSSGLYVILNTHHETWLIPSRKDISQMETKFITLWEQIADRFSGYDERLLFEGMNEPRLIGTAMEWTEGTPEARDMINHLNQVFVDTIRAMGGNNTERYLLIPTYCAKTYEDALKDFAKLGDLKVGVSIHIYSPYSFAQDSNGTKEWQNNENEGAEKLDTLFQYIKAHLIDRKIPVVITEFGAINKDNEKSRAEWTAYIVEFAAEHNISYAWWDSGGRTEKDDTFNLFDRYNLEWKYPGILKELIRP